MKSLFFITITILFLLTPAVSTPAQAADTCMPVYGGGVTTKQVCPTPSPKLVPLPQNNTKTTGGQTVYPAGTSKSTPSTGPESIGYVVLLAMLLGGFYLRRKTKHSI